MDIIYEYEKDSNSIKNLSDEELTKLIFESYLNDNWECKLCDFALRQKLHQISQNLYDRLIPFRVLIAGAVATLPCRQRVARMPIT